MNYSVDKNIRAFETTYGGNYPTEILYQIQYKKFPSTWETEEKYHMDVILFFKNENFEFIGRNKYHSKRASANIDDMIFGNEKLQLIAILQHKEENKEQYVNLRFLYDAQANPIELLIDFNKLKKIKEPKNDSTIKLVSSDKGYLDTNKYTVKVPKMELELNYGKNFISTHNKILEKLNTTDEKGIVLLHGIPGSGKSTYLKYLTTLIKDKDVLFIPPSMASALSEPSIIPFLMDRPNSILIIEDGEKIISKRETVGSSEGVSNLLNLTDGILGDCLKIQVIVTFNMEKKLIDEALLRKGRLIAEHQFDKLTVENTKKLLKHLKKDFTSNEGLTLADIYNFDDDEIRVQFGMKKAGFKYE